MGGWGGGEQREENRKKAAQTYAKFWYDRTQNSKTLNNTSLVSHTKQSLAISSCLSPPPPPPHSHFTIPRFVPFPWRHTHARLEGDWRDVGAMLWLVHHRRWDHALSFFVLLNINSNSSLSLSLSLSLPSPQRDCHGR